ncbi:hypothetical protein, partial [Plasmodium yoelii yoelii]
MSLYLMKILFNKLIICIIFVLISIILCQLN